MHVSLASLLGHFLPSSLIVVLKEEGPDKMLNLFDGESDTPELIWDGEMRGELRNIAGIELDSCMQYRRETGHGNDHFKLSDGSKVFLCGVLVWRLRLLHRASPPPLSCASTRGNGAAG